MEKKRNQPKEKSRLHPKNLHKSRYDLQVLSKEASELKAFVFVNEHGVETIPFSNPDAVKALNKALLKHFYKIEDWKIPDGYLCPPVPGRADYIHYLADLLADKTGVFPQGNEIRCLDIGVGAGCVYPLLGHSIYGWSFIGSDIDETAIQSSQSILDANPAIKPFIELRKQSDSTKIFEGVLDKSERITATICNPPFHSSEQDAVKSAMRKVRNLGYTKKELNFGGQQHELWCEGGEVKFIDRMIKESRLFKENCKWFTTLVSQESHLDEVYKLLENVEPSDVKTIAMGQGNKVSRILAWRF